MVVGVISVISQLMEGSPAIAGGFLAKDPCVARRRCDVFLDWRLMVLFGNSCTSFHHFLMDIDGLMMFYWCVFVVYYVLFALEWFMEWKLGNGSCVGHVMSCNWQVIFIPSPPTWKIPIRPTCRSQHRFNTGWWFGTMEFYDFPFSWECHHHWLSLHHFSGWARLEPPTR